VVGEGHSQDQRSKPGADVINQKSQCLIYNQPALLPPLCIEPDSPGTAL